MRIGLEKRNSIIVSLLSSFFLYQLIYILFSKEESIYILNLSLKSFIIQIPTMAIITIAIFMFLNKDKLENKWTVFYMAVLSYLLLLIIKINIPLIIFGISIIIAIFLVFIKAKIDDKLFSYLMIFTGAVLLIKIVLLNIFTDKLMNISDYLVENYFGFQISNTLSSNFLLSGIISVLIFTMVYLIIRKYIWKDEEKLLKILFYIVLFLGILQISYLMVIMVSRVITFSTPTYDMGIFTQMFHNMDKGNGPVTTIERDALLSHLKVHISPIYYLILPIFKIFPSGVTLEIVQILIVVSGVIPLYKILKEYRIEKIVLILIVGIYLVSPLINAGSLYDLHENCFLAPLLLWLFYFTVKNSKLGILIFTIFTLMVKEDAGLYIVFIGLYFLFRKNDKEFTKDKIYRLIMLIIVPIIVFILSVKYLENFGDGAMLGRYFNLTSYKEMGIKGILITFIQNFSYFITVLFKTNKLYYILVAFGTMMFIPLFQKHWYNYFLICPLIVVNLLSDYQYQHSLVFQYNYGSSVLLMVLLIITISEFKINRKFISFLLMGGIVFSAVITYKIYDDKSYPVDKLENIEEYKITEKLLDKIPKDSVVLAETYYTNYLSKNIFDLYDLRYHNEGEYDGKIDFIVVPKNLGEEYKYILENYLNNGYKLQEENKIIEIYGKERLE